MIYSKIIHRLCDFVSSTWLTSQWLYWSAYAKCNLKEVLKYIETKCVFIVGVNNNAKMDTVIIQSRHLQYTKLYDISHFKCTEVGLTAFPTYRFESFSQQSSAKKY